MVESSYVTIAHGAGARETWALIEKLILSKIPAELRRVERGYGTDVLDDGAVIPIGSEYLVITVDSFTVNPIRFPGGDIGHLAACGTINDLVVMGARPVAFMDSIVVEEGFPLSELEEIVSSMIRVLVDEGVAIVGGDFKVMPRGSIDKVVITGVGLGIAKKPIVDVELRPGDKIVVTGPIAEHGATILAAQLGMLDKVDVKSDSKPLTKTLLPVIERYRDYIHAARDPTRGGLAAVLNEWASRSKLTIFVDRSAIPIRDGVREFLEAMGVDPLSMACEGVAILAVEPSVADEVVEELRKRGEVHAAIIGEVKRPPTDFLKGRVVAITEVGGRVLLEPKSINLPRIC